MENTQFTRKMRWLTLHLHIIRPSLLRHLAQKRRTFNQFVSQVHKQCTEDRDSGNDNRFVKCRKRDCRSRQRRFSAAKMRKVPRLFFLSLEFETLVFLCSFSCCILTGRCSENLKFKFGASISPIRRQVLICFWDVHGYVYGMEGPQTECDLYS